MANPNVGQRVAANWELVVKTKPEDQIHDDYWLFNRLSKGEGFVGKSGGDFITCPVEYALNGTVSSYSDLDLISTTRYDVFDRYESPWKEYAGTYVMSDLESDRNAGEGQVFDLRQARQPEELDQRPVQRRPVRRRHGQRVESLHGLAGARLHLAHLGRRAGGGPRDLHVGAQPADHGHADHVRV
jgi:hypothetical protein